MKGLKKLQSSTALAIQITSKQKALCRSYPVMNLIIQHEVKGIYELLSLPISEIDLVKGFT